MFAGGFPGVCSSRREGLGSSIVDSSRKERGTVEGKEREGGRVYAKSQTDRANWSSNFKHPEIIHLNSPFGYICAESIPKMNFARVLLVSCL